MLTNDKYVLAMGELLIDAISSTQVDDLSQARYLNIHTGGSTANFCRYLKRCGTLGHIVAAVGEDGFGKILLEKVVQEGLETTHIHVTPKHFTSLIVVGRTAQTPDFIPYRDADKFIPAIDEDLLKNAAWLHTSSFALSAEPAQTNILRSIGKAVIFGVPASVDWNYSEKIWDSHEQALQIFRQLLNFNVSFKFSLDDVSRFWQHPDIDIPTALAYLEQVQAAFVCLTCGGDGVYYKNGQATTWEYAAVQPIKVQNATGAGDSFWAGYIHARLAGEENDSLAVGNAIRVASLKLQGLLV
ncbi:PfkB family carbohydrate kinase [Flexibacter flexilis]|nr:PfkB family carbohydrate kinase [Flexibacter flexilis]